MLVLSRKKGERIHIGEGIVLTVLGWQGNKVRVGIEAPKDVIILREEIQNHWRDGTVRGKANQNKVRLRPVH
jgi:carbon storage regulator